MTGQMKQGEDIEHYANKHEEREQALREDALLDNIDVVDVRGNWISGYAFGKFSFDAKVFETANEDFGITSHEANGHISKLTVRQDDKVVFNYDRGFDESSMDVDDEADIIQAIELYIDRNLG